MNGISEQVIESNSREVEALTSTLNQLSSIDRYNQWMYEQFAASLGHRVLEVGSGTGNITQFLLTENREVVATDIVPNYRQELQTKFSHHPKFRLSTFDLDRIIEPEFKKNPFDSVVCLNVLEHIEDDLFALRQIYEALKPGGKLSILVPAHQFLFGAFDDAVGHYRRYNKASLSSRLIEAGFQVESLKYFNAAATLPWFVNGRLLKRNYLPNDQVSLADKLVPLLRLEKFFGPPFGISVIAVAVRSR